MTNHVFLGFDFGTKRTGVAVGQSITRTATPVSTIAMEQGEPADWSEIETLMTTWRPAALVVGLPLNMDGTEQTITELAQAFAKALAQRTGLPVHGVDERLSTQHVRQQVFEQGGYKALQRADIDSLSAKMILEQWMRHHAQEF